MINRVTVYRGLCAILGVYAVFAIAAAAGESGAVRPSSARFYLYIGAHAFLMAMAGVRLSRPAAAGTTGSLLLTLAMALAVVAGSGLRRGFGPEWLAYSRLALMAVVYLGLRLSSPRAPGSFPQSTR